MSKVIYLKSLFNKDKPNKQAIKLIDEAITKQYSYHFTVTRVGIEETIYNFAFKFPLIYGLISLAIAAITGWSGAEIFRRFKKS